MPDTTPLSAQATQFLSTLEGSAYPQALVDKYPRIVNSIVAARNDPVELKNYMQSLLRDARGGRQGFPLDVLMDIQAMSDLLVPPDTEPDGTLKWF